MARKRHTTEDIINKLREAEVGLARGLAVPDVCRKLGVTEQTYYRWRKEYGGLSRDQAKRLRSFADERGAVAGELAQFALGAGRDERAATTPSSLASTAGSDAAVAEVLAAVGVAEGAEVLVAVGVPVGLTVGGRRRVSLYVSDLLARVRCPTLVIRSRSEEMVGVSQNASKQLAATIPNGRLLVYEALQFRHVDEGLGEVISQFLDEDDDRMVREQRLPTGTTVILFADIADSTALTERLGDEAFREKARGLDGALRKAIAGAGGTAIEGKVLGDGVLATFSSAKEGIEGAMAIHKAGSHAGMPLHVGIHAGDVIREDNNVYGGAVNIASRVAVEAATGETLVSATVRELARTSAAVTFEDRGEHALKGVEDPVRLYEVRWRKDA